MVVYCCNLSTLEAGESQTQGHPYLFIKIQGQPELQSMAMHAFNPITQMAEISLPLSPKHYEYKHAHCA